MTPVYWSGKARRDLLGQCQWIARDNPRAALRVRDRIEAAVAILTRHPDAGRRGRLAGTRGLVVARTPFIAVYRHQGGRITILRLIHGRQLWPRGE